MKEKKSNLVEIAGELRNDDKPMALAIWCGEYEEDPRPNSKTGKREKWIWLPKSQVQDNMDGTFTMPEWLAKDKGFI